MTLTPFSAPGMRSVHRGYGCPARGVFARGQISEAAVRPRRIVILPMRLDGRWASSRLTNQLSFKHSSRSRPLELSAKALDRLARVDELQVHAALVRPLIQRLARELRPIVTGDHLRKAAGLPHAVQDAPHLEPHFTFCSSKFSYQFDCFSAKIHVEFIRHVSPKRIAAYPVRAWVG